MEKEKTTTPPNIPKLLKALIVAVVAYVLSFILNKLVGTRLLTPLIVYPATSALAVAVAAKLYCGIVEKKKTHSIITFIIAFFLPGLVMQYAHPYRLGFNPPEVIIQNWRYISMILWVALATLIPANFAVRRTYDKPKVKSKAEIANENKLNKWRPFYEECAKFKITSASDLTAADKHQRAELIAKKFNLPSENVEDLFQPEHEGWKLYTETIAAEAEAEMEEKRSKEREADDWNKKYAAMHGTEKRIAMLQATVDGYKAINASYQRLINGTHLEKESDGAIAAGVASGIGGVVPALMSLQNTAEHNAQVRSNNSVGVQMIKYYTECQMQNTGYRMFWEKELERAKTKLAGDQSSEEVFKHLTIETDKIKVTDTGTIEITARFKGDPEYTIFDNMPAIVDGAVTAQVYDGETLVGEAVIVLPTYGTGLYKLTSWDDKTLGGYRESQVRLKREPGSLDTGMRSYVEAKGYCLFSGEKDKKYTVKYAPNNLYAIEI
ncbi:MAG: hypothetical protein HFE63_05720 [Clostridiales bacterium]|nr:hypothetical protein [Clostridiales bacterium]